MERSQEMIKPSKEVFISKEMIHSMQREGEDYLTLQQAANEAVRYADALIKELKK